jgi:DNA-binding SARP family transcriptional activator/TolB-like protein
MPRLSLSLLGGFECRVDGGDALRFPTRKVRALLVYLAVNAGRTHTRDKLATLLWGDQSDAQARANLRKAMSRLGQTLPKRGKRCLAIQAGGLAIRPDALRLDVTRFERLAADGTPGSLERAADLYRGQFLEGFAACGEDFDEWLMAERERLDETLRQVLQRLLDHYVATGAIGRATQVALRLIMLDPMQESVHRTLMRLYLHQDRVGSALEQYRRCREVLNRELAVEPSAETEEIRADALKLLPGGGNGSVPGRESDQVLGRAVTLPASGPDRGHRRAELTGRPSIVVLSFGRVGDAADSHLGEGMTEDITTELTRFRELDVIAPTTALAYRQAGVPARRVGAELGTTYLVEGTLRKLGERLRITVCLMETETGRQVWGERYDCGLAEIFEVQDDVVRRIVGSLVGGIERARLDAARRRRPDEWQAYELYLQGWSTLKRVDVSAIREARDFFHRAIEKDPQFGRAYCGLALALWKQWACYSWNSWAVISSEALDLARKAVALDDGDHRAHCILGVAHLYGQDYAAARRQLVKALELNPNDADVLAHVSFGMALIGEPELAVKAGRTALRLQPRHPDWYAGLVGIALFGARRHQEAIETMVPGVEAFCSTPAFIAASYGHLEQVAEAAHYRETVCRHYGNWLARGAIPPETTCIEWLVSIDPFQRPEDAEHYVVGLRKAGFE